MRLCGFNNLRFRVEYDTDHMTIGSFRGQYLIHLHPVDESEAVYEIRHLSQGVATNPGG